MYILKSKDYYYIIKIKGILNIISPISKYIITFFIKKASYIDAYLKTFIIKYNLVKDLMRKKLY